MRTRLQGVEHTTEHRVGVAGGSEVPVDRVLDRTHFDQLFVMQTFSVFSLLSRLGRKVFEVVVAHRRQVDVRRVVKVEVLLRTVIREMRRVESTSEKERLVVFLFELVDGPVDANRISHLFFFVVGDRSPLEKESGFELLSPVVNARRERLRNGRFAAP